MADIRLIATDLDGTLIGETNEFHHYENLREAINELRRENQAIWVVCTGRSLNSFSDVFSAIGLMGAVPDMVVVHHAYIYARTPLGYLPHIFWNLRIMMIQRSSARSGREVIDKWYDSLSSGSFGRVHVRRNNRRMAIKLDSEEATDALAEVIKKDLGRYSSIRVFKFKNEIDIRSVPFTKGLALVEIQKHLGIKPENTLAIGNGHNDISMFLPEAAGMTGCPSGSEPEVIRDVHEKGGHISRFPSLEGVLDIILAHRRGLVDSTMPAGWVNPEQTAGRKIKSAKKKDFKHLYRMIIMIFCSYTVICVFANFGLLPFSGLIMKPFMIIQMLLEKLLELRS